MRSMDCYPKAAMERAMKVQDVMLQAMAKKITWWQAAEILGISDRHLRRWRARYAEDCTAKNQPSRCNSVRWQGSKCPAERRVMKGNALVSSAARDPRYQAVVVFFLCALLAIASGLAQAQGGVVDSTLNPIQPAPT